MRMFALIFEDRFILQINKNIGISKNDSIWDHRADVGKLQQLLTASKTPLFFFGYEHNARPNHQKGDATD